MTKKFIAGIALANILVAGLMLLGSPTVSFITLIAVFVFSIITSISFRRNRPDSSAARAIQNAKRYLINSVMNITLAAGSLGVVLTPQTPWYATVIWALCGLMWCFNFYQNIGLARSSLKDAKDLAELEERLSQNGSGN